MNVVSLGSRDRIPGTLHGAKPQRVTAITDSRDVPDFSTR